MIPEQAFDVHANAMIVKMFLILMLVVYDSVVI